MNRAARLAALALLALLTACSATPDLEPPAELEEFTPTAGVSRVWAKLAAGVIDYQAVRIRPFAGGGQVFDADPGGVVIARDAETGSRTWRLDLDEPIAAGIGGGGGRLFVATRRERLIALSFEGERLWSVTLPGEVLTLPVAAEGWVVVRSVDGRTAAFDTATGAPGWTHRSTVPPLSLRGVGEPLIHQGRVVLGLDNGRVLVLGLNSGSLLWERTVAVPRGRSEVERLVDVDSPPIADGGDLFVAGFQGRAVRLDLANGAIRWSQELSTNRPMALDERRLFITDEVGVIWALDRETGTALWKQDGLRRRRVTGPSVHGEYLAVGDFEGYVHWLSRFDGAFAVRHRIHDTAVSEAPLTDRDRLVVRAREVLAALRVVRTAR